MSKLRLAVAALAVVASAPAFAQTEPAAAPAAAAPAPAPVGGEDAGWNTRYGMVFELQNILQNPDFLGGYQPDTSRAAGVGLQLNLDAQHAVRGYVRLSRVSDKFERAKVTDLTTGVTTTTGIAPGVACNFGAGAMGAVGAFNVDNKCTSAYDVALGANYVVRLGTAAIAPYVGAGALLDYKRFRADWKDDVDPTDVFKYDATRTDLTVALGGQLGLEWRLHRMISIFAEYGLNVDLIRYSSVDAKVERNQTGLPRDGYKLKDSKAIWFNFDTGLNQGAQLGLIAFF